MTSAFAALGWVHTSQIGQIERRGEALFDALKKQYDLIIIDAPPLLRVAYATTLARLVDRVMIVVAHGSDIHIAEELRDQVELVGTPRSAMSTTSHRCGPR